MDFGFADLGLEIEDFTEPGRIVQLGFAPNRVGLMTTIDGVAFSEVWAGRVEGNYGTTRVFFIGRQELIRNKKASAYPQDLADLSWLEKA